MTTVVIGGGLAGCAAAWYLARDGVEVTLIEAGEVNQLASGSNAGSLHAQIPHEPFVLKGEGWGRMFSPTVRLLRASLAMWAGLEAELDADLEVKFGGGMLVGQTREEARQIAAKAEIQRAAGVETELIGAAELAGRAPYLAPGAEIGAFAPIEGKANPLLVAPAFARAATAAGATIVTRAGKAAIVRERQGYSVHWTGGSIATRRIVVAAGAATGPLLESLGIHLAIDAVPIQVSVTELAEPFLPHLVYAAAEKLTMKQARNGSVLIGGGWEACIDARGRPYVNAANLATNLALACRTVPGVASLSIVRSWPAIVNGTDDWMPILGELPAAPGIFLSYVPWLGFSAGPAAARAIASMVQGKVPEMDVDFRAFAP
ncbi:NAD(P)/FAD-dependent oxidoreductase [Sphingomonas baiyangensis]|uniref:NAD(P)/FAD-dependent oxidoreductase n=1 Tax=Sphingomonas baiyangensis TaxID=2572576 RepID=UPI00146C9E97|nr:FAD-binding oxidoreductase [Sphingomonas baiyangensis]